MREEGGGEVPCARGTRRPEAPRTQQRVRVHTAGGVRGPRERNVALSWQAPEAGWSDAAVSPNLCVLRLVEERRQRRNVAKAQKRKRRIEALQGGGADLES